MTTFNFNPVHSIIKAPTMKPEEKIKIILPALDRLYPQAHTALSS